jgi:hypothetical protein
VVAGIKDDEHGGLTGTCPGAGTFPGGGTRPCAWTCPGSEEHEELAGTRPCGFPAHWYHAGCTLPEEGPKAESGRGGKGGWPSRSGVPLRPTGLGSTRGRGPPPSARERTAWEGDRTTASQGGWRRTEAREDFHFRLQGPRGRKSEMSRDFLQNMYSTCNTTSISGRREYSCVCILTRMYMKLLLLAYVPHSFNW